jgi:hypothetical protein
MKNSLKNWISRKGLTKDYGWMAQKPSYWEREDGCRMLRIGFYESLPTINNKNFSDKEIKEIIKEEDIFKTLQNLQSQGAPEPNPESWLGIAAQMAAPTA